MSSITTDDSATRTAVKGHEYQEGPVARSIEEQTSKIPSDLFLWAAGGAIITSLAFQALHRRQVGNFVAQMAPALLILGLYNKLVKVAGHQHPRT